MQNRGRTVLAGLAAALVIALAAGTASANTFSYSESSFDIFWTSLTFSESGGGVTIRCPVTLEGRFNESTVPTTLGEQVARITAATIGTCQEGNASIVRESLPWEVTYQGFTGTLPAITSVRHYLIGAAFLVEPGGRILCLAETSTTWPASGTATREAGGNITSLSADSELPIPVTGGETCPEFGVFSGGGEVFVHGSRERRVRLSLI